MTTVLTAKTSPPVCQTPEVKTRVKLENDGSFQGVFCECELCGEQVAFSEALAHANKHKQNTDEIHHGEPAVGPHGNEGTKMNFPLTEDVTLVHAYPQKQNVEDVHGRKPAVGSSGNQATKITYPFTENVRSASVDSNDSGIVISYSPGLMSPLANQNHPQAPPSLTHEFTPPAEPLPPPTTPPRRKGRPPKNPTVVAGQVAKKKRPGKAKEKSLLADFVKKNMCTDYPTNPLISRTSTPPVGWEACPSAPLMSSQRSQYAGASSVVPNRKEPALRTLLSMPPKPVPANYQMQNVPSASQSVELPGSYHQKLQSSIPQQHLYQRQHHQKSVYQQQQQYQKSLDQQQKVPPNVYQHHGQMPQYLPQVQHRGQPTQYSLHREIPVQSSQYFLQHQNGGQLPLNSFQKQIPGQPPQYLLQHQNRGQLMQNSTEQQVQGQPSKYLLHQQQNQGQLQQNYQPQHQTQGHRPQYLSQQQIRSQPSQHCSKKQIPGQSPQYQPQQQQMRGQQLQLLPQYHQRESSQSTLQHHQGLQQHPVLPPQLTGVQNPPQNFRVPLPVPSTFPASYAALFMFKCQFCPQRFKAERDIRAHHKLDHRISKEFMWCAFCGKNFGTEIQLNQHILAEHSSQNTAGW